MAVNSVGWNAKITYFFFPIQKTQLNTAPSNGKVWNLIESVELREGNSRHGGVTRGYNFAVDSLQNQYGFFSKIGQVLNS